MKHFRLRLYYKVSMRAYRYSHVIDLREKDEDLDKLVPDRKTDRHCDTLSS